MKKLLAFLVISAAAMAQQPSPLLNTWISGITQTTIYDNRPSQTRQMKTVTLACSGTGTWSADISYGSTSTGSFTSYGSSASISNSSSVPVASGFLYNYPNFVKVTISGTVTCNLSGYQRFLLAPSGSGGSSAFNDIISGTNTTAAMIIGTGASLAATGSGTITATVAPLSGITGLGTGVSTFLATPTSANLAAAITNETGSGALVFATSPTLVTPNLGTPSSVTLTNGTGLPISTGLIGAGTGVLSAMANAVSGSGSICLTTNCSMTTPSLGTPSALVLTNATGLPTAGILNNAVTLAKLATQSNNTILSNISGISAVPSANTLTATLDAILGTTQGSIIYRDASGYTLLGPGVSGQFLKTQGASANPIWASAGGTGTCNVTGFTINHVPVSDGSDGCAQSPITMNSTAGVAGSIDMPQGTSATVAANSFGWGAPTSMTTSVRLESPNAVPSANNVMLFGAPSSNVASWTWTGISGSGSFCMTTSCAMTTPNLGTPSALVLTNATGLPAAQVPAVALTSGTSITMSNSQRFFECTSTCTITMPVPSAGVQYCVRNANNVSTVITFAAVGSGVRYENTANTAYGTAGTGTLVSGGAVGDKICLVGLDATHYDVFSYNGTWTAS